MAEADKGSGPEGGSVNPQRTTGSGNRPLRCLSLVLRKSHAGFLEGWGAGNGPLAT